MKNLAIAGFCAVFLASAGAATSRAQTEDDLTRVVKSGICPEDLQTYDSVKYADHCAGMDERSCDINDKACFTAASECWAQVNAMNKQIYTYNNFMKKCAAEAPPPAAPLSITPPPAAAKKKSAAPKKQ